MEEAYCPKRRSDVRVRHVEGESVILDRQTGRIHQLNRTASYLWERCDGHATLEDLCAHLLQAFDVEAQTAAADVAAIVRQLQTLHLLDSCGGLPPP